MPNPEIMRIADGIARDKNIEREQVYVDIEQAIASGLRKQFNTEDTSEFTVQVDGKPCRAVMNVSLKEAQTATVYNHENPEMLGMASMMGDFHMSSLVDNILLMNWIEIGDAFRLAMTVAKMRANPNARATHECEILSGQGMRVLPRQIPAPMVRPFSSYLNLVSRSPARSPDPGAPDPGAA